MPNDQPAAALIAAPAVRAAPMDQPWAWLARGWADLRRSPSVSLAHGFAVFCASALLALTLWLAGLPYLLMPMLGGFAMIAPLLAAGLYEASRRHEAGEPVTLAVSLQAIGRNPTQLGLMGVALLLIHLVWVRIATLLFALFFGLREITLTSLLDFLLTPSVSLPFLIVGTGVGAALAAASFAISCVAIPMLIDRDCNVVQAIVGSVEATRVSFPAMTLWAAIIAAATGIGLVTGGLGLIVLMPLIGHATWHAYRDVVVPAAAPDAPAA